jgi:hypothetical protein
MLVWDRVTLMHRAAGVVVAMYAVRAVEAVLLALLETDGAALGEGDGLGGGGSLPLPEAGTVGDVLPAGVVGGGDDVVGGGDGDVVVGVGDGGGDVVVGVGVGDGEVVVGVGVGVGIVADWHF